MKTDTPKTPQVVDSARIDGGRVYLRILREADATERYASWLNDPETNRHLETKGATPEDLGAYIHERENHPDCRFWGIFLKDGEQHIGNVKLEPIHWDRRSAVFGILLGDPMCRGQGIGPEVTRLVVQHAFSSLGLKEVRLGVLLGNTSAIRSYEKVGFVQIHVKNNAMEMAITPEGLKS